MPCVWSLQHQSSWFVVGLVLWCGSFRAWRLWLRVSYKMVLGDKYSPASD